MRIAPCLVVVGLIGLVWLSGPAPVGAQSADLLDKLRFGLKSGKTTPEEVVKEIGEPAARYQVDDEQYWLYEIVREEKDGKRLCPEVMLRKGTYRQTNWMPEETMKSAIAVAKTFAGWSPPAEIRTKTFTVRDTTVEGKSRAEILAKFGEPDVKRVFDGKETWDWRKVPLEAGSEKLLTVTLQFEGDTVSRSIAN